MAKRCRSRVTSSNDDGTADETSPMDTDSESDRGYETELTDPDSDVPRDRRRGKRKRRRLRYRPNAPVPKEDAAAAATDDSDDDTDPEDDTEDDISSGDEDDDYSPGTKLLIARMEDHWQWKKAKTSADPKWRDPVDALRGAGRRDLYLFFNWRFKLKLGKGGRRLRGTKKSSALKGDWKNFLRYYEGATGTKIDAKLMRLTRKSLRRLAKKRGLDVQEKEKTPVYVEDMSPLQETTLRTQEKRFWLGLQRMQICLYNLLGLFTLNRKSAILALRYKDLRVSLQWDPNGGPHLPTVEFSYEFTKKHLGLTQTNTFILPEIIYDPSLILSPHNFLFGILFFFGAFKATNLTSMKKLRGLKIGGGRQQKPIPLKPEMANYYVFCRVEKVDGKVRILPEDKMDPSSAIRTIAEICGFLHPWFNHRCRYGGGLVGDAEQNLVLKHASIRTFLDHYLPRLVDINMQPLISGQDPNSPLMRAITRIGRWLDKRRPRHLTDAQKATVEQDPELQEAILKRDRAEQRVMQTNSPKGVEKFERRNDDVKKTRNRLLYRYRKQVWEEFDDEQAVIDIERQLSGMALNEEAKETLQEEQMLPAQIHLLENLLTWPTSRSVEKELRRRDAGVEAVRMYCGVLEGGPRRGRRPKPNPPLAPQASDDTDNRNDRPDEDAPNGWDDALRAAEEHIRHAEKPRGCFECFAHPGSSDHRRIYQYSRPADLGRHFRDDLLRHLKDGEPARCSWCEIKLEHKMHVQSHAKKVHRVHT
ncbi:predicted protein [Histoplasma mississippiense (nom. inval.)]|uniref:predicted protein n=1 Tax=Ajellomyces capsulatus (strain NAm1 / WU24) TaxID=2059318 RepID=UPI000157BEF6|nr:predicted protein [Histoplasma mississippiense (nom. inval.)]EDN06475.1 predicted protein [Histoplasma mississippiense (nom. inval.)]